MAAMAPALTDASAEAHRIRFKLAPPSSTLSPTSGVEGSVASSNGAVKRKTSEERPAPPHPRGAGSCKRAETGEAETPPTTTPLGKLQPIVTSYRFSDVTSAKESLVLLRGRNILPGLLPHKHQTLELSEEQFKSIMSGGGNGGLCGPSPLQSGVGVAVNGVSKKFPKPGSERDNGVTLNGGSHVGQDSLFQNRTGSPALTGNGPRRGVAAERRQYPRGTSQDGSSNREAPSPFATSASELEEEKITERTQFCRDASSPSGLGTELRDRTQQSCSRQGEIEGRLRRLRKRLQVVQAKQVERHSQQQLGGLVDSTLGRGAGTLTPQERDRLGRFLKGGSVPAELERLSVSCITNLRSAENAFDSDATESSSGGETDVEEDEIARADVDQRHIPLWRRAEGRYAVDRAAIISHWNWLQAHVSDLEYRIRQQTDIYRQIRACKGFVMLGESSVCESVRDDGGVSRTQSIVSPITQVRGADEMDGSFSGHGIPTETTLRKGCAPVRQVNGVIGSLRASAVDSADPDQQQQQQRVCPAVPSGPDSSCVSARTRPLLSCKRRRLLRPGNSSAAFSSNLNRKVQKLVGSRCGCDVSEQCMMCCGRSSSLSSSSCSSSSSSSSSSLAPAEPQYQLPLLDRLAHFDPCVHPILSFPDDVGVSLHLQRVMKCHWQGRPLEKIKPIKKLSLKHKLATSSRLPDPSSSSSSKDKHRLTNSLHTPVRFSHYRIRSEKLFRQQQQQQQHHHHQQQQHQQHQQQQGDGESRSYHRPERSHIPYEKSHSRKRPREHSLERLDNAPKMYTEVSSPCPSLSGLSTPTHSPLVRQMSTSESPTPFSINNTTPAPIRRRRGESSFDINNIVIPMSVAATTRVEKLQYKEILTPSWRVVDITAKKISTEDDCVEIEDLSDGVFAQLHLPYEEQEHSRWSWTPSAIAKRRGSRSFKSVDGRTTPLLGGTTPSTPQPSSPDTAHFHLLQDYSSAASPTSPASPEMLTLSGMHTPGPRDAQRLLSNEDTRCSTPDTIYEEMPVQPWERRNFPLEQDPPLESKEQSSPAPERPFRTMRRISGCKTGSSRSESDAGPPSPSPLPEDSSKQKPNTPKPTHR